MIQDIEPYRFRNEFTSKVLDDNSYICMVRDNAILADVKDGRLDLPVLSRIRSGFSEPLPAGQYLFSIDEQSFFLLPEPVLTESDGLEYVDMKTIRTLEPTHLVFAASLGVQMNRWYDKNRFCGHCGHAMVHHPLERAMICECCKQVVYPTLSPSVIVALIDGDRILLTKYAGREYTRYALVAGYTEFGETLEQTVSREVMEEVGLNVKNIRYYKSQPWPFSDALLVGYFAELDGDDRITLDETELSEAVWYRRDEIPVNPSWLSLTNEMIEHFRLNKKSL